MKRVLYILFLGICLACGKGVEKGTFVFQGKIEGVGNRMDVTYVDTLNKRASVLLECRDSFFSETLKLSESQVVRINFVDGRFWKMVGRGFIPCNSSYLMFVAQPGHRLEVTGHLTKDFVDLYPGGDAENEVFRKYTSALHPVLNDCVNLQVKNMTDSTLTVEEKAANDRKMEEYNERMQEIRMAFLEKHVSSVGGLWLLEDMLVRTQLTMEEAERLFEKVDGKYAELAYYKDIAARIQGAKQTAVGQQAPSIMTNRTYDGQPFNLEAWRGKYVLIDFWGTWCGACIAGMPEMKKFAAKHADKLMLLGIAKESDEQRWRQYLDKSEWNWKQIMVGEGEEDYVVRYNVQGFPTKILVAPDGRILKRLVGEDPQFYKELEQLMN